VKRLVQFAEFLFLVSLAASPWYAIHRWGPKIDQILGHVDTLLSNANSTVSIVRGAARVEELAATQQTNDIHALVAQGTATVAHLSDSATRLDAAIDSLTAFVQHSDSQMNEHALPQLALALAGFKSAAAEIEGDAAAARPAIVLLNASAEDLAAAMHTLPLTMHLAQATVANGEHVSAQASAASDLALAKFRQMMKPVTGAKAAFKAAADWIARLLGSAL
jgi:hypothetical protein